MGGSDEAKAGLRKGRLKGADIGWSDLRGETLDGADLEGTSLGRADLRGARPGQSEDYVTARAE